MLDTRTPQTDLAGVIGTWIAVFLASVALLGIIGPVILLREIRSKYNRALNAVDDRQHRYISRGVRISKRSRIFRQINAPALSNPPELSREVLFRNDDAMEPASNTGWIMFALTLKAYNIRFPTGDELILENDQIWLPVHRLWILGFGLLGRYGFRTDRGRELASRNMRRLDYVGLEDNENEYSRYDANKRLHGATGSLKHVQNEEFDALYFSPNSRELRGSLRPDNVSLSELFWLAVGCIPAGNRVFDLSSYDEQRITDVDRKEQNGLNEVDIFPEIWREYNRREEIKNPGKNTFGGRNYTDEFAREAASDEEEEQGSGLLGCSFFRFEALKVTRPESRFIAWARAMGCETADLLLMEKQTISADEESETLLAQDDQSSWLQVDSLYWHAAAGKKILIWRSDVHCMALALLLLPWSPQHFLFGSVRGRFGHELLCRASVNLSTLMAAARRSVQGWDLPTDQKMLLSNVIEELDNYTSQTSGSRSDIYKEWRLWKSMDRSRSKAHYALDSALSSASQSALIIRNAIGILYLSSTSFRQIVGELAQNVSLSRSCTAEVDMTSNVFRISSPKHEAQQYRLEFAEVFLGEKILPSTVNVSYQELLLSCLKACGRSEWFREHIQSSGLLELVEMLRDTALVATSYQPALRRRRARPATK
jgi:hypothetical protein